MKRTKHLIITLALMMLPILAFADTWSDGTVTWTYTLDASNNATITQGNVGSDTGTLVSGDVVLPETVNGYG